MKITTHKENSAIVPHPSKCSPKAVAREVNDWAESMAKQARFSKDVKASLYEVYDGIYEYLMNTVEFVPASADSSFEITLQREDFEFSIPYGNVRVPIIDEKGKVSYQGKLFDLAVVYNGGTSAMLVLKCAKMYEEGARRTLRKIAEYISKSTIIRSRVLRIPRGHFGDPDTGHPFEPENRPIPIKKGVSPTQIIYPERTRKVLQGALFNVIRYPDLVPKISRSILLHSSYGTGKTLTASAVIHEVMEFNKNRNKDEEPWTLLKIEDPHTLNQAIEIYGAINRLIIFMEDLEAIAASSASDEERSPALNRLLELLDGTDTKTEGKDLILLMTSNAPESIHASLMRPGRIDYCIRIHPVMEETATQFLRMYLGKAFDEKADYSEVAARMDGMSPAFAQALCQRCIEANFDPENPHRTKKVTVNELIAHLDDIQEHIRYTMPRKNIPTNPFVRAAAVLGTLASGKEPSAEMLTQPTSDEIPPSGDFLVNPEVVEPPSVDIPHMNPTA